METITIRPRTERQMAFLKELLANLRWDAEVEYGRAGELPEEERFWPELDRKIDRALKERARGESYKVSTESFGKFMESI